MCSLGDRHLAPLPEAHLHLAHRQEAVLRSLATQTLAGHNAGDVGIAGQPRTQKTITCTQLGKEPAVSRCDQADCNLPVFAAAPPAGSPHYPAIQPAHTPDRCCNESKDSQRQLAGLLERPRITNAGGGDKLTPAPAAPATCSRPPTARNCAGRYTGMPCNCTHNHTCNRKQC